MIRSINSRPRERLRLLGAHVLSSEELLAILIGTGVQGKSAMVLAHGIIKKFKSFRAMSDLSPMHWQEFKGVGEAKCARICAAVEIARRIQEEHAHFTHERVLSSRDAAGLFMPRLQDLRREVFQVMFLDARHRVITIHEVTRGTVDHASPIIREIFHKAIEHFAVSLICGHNHPSGNSEPSTEDKRFTQELVHAGSVLKIPVLDHIIIADLQHFSFADEGLI